MRRINEINLLVILVSILIVAAPQTVQASLIEADRELTQQKQVRPEIDKKIDGYLEEYLKEDLTNQEKTKESFPTDYLKEQLIEDEFSEEEINKALNKIIQDRKEEVKKQAQDVIKENPCISRKMLENKLVAKSFFKEEVKEVVDSLTIDWIQHAVRFTEEFMQSEIGRENQGISRQGLTQILVEEKQFTRKEAEEAVSVVVIDWKRQAVRQIEHYLEEDYYSKRALSKRLISEGFKKEELADAFDQLKINWQEQAVKKAEVYVEKTLLLSKKELISYLKQQKFTADEVVYATTQYFPKEKKEEDKTEETEEIEEVEETEVKNLYIPESIMPVEETIPAVYSKDIRSKGTGKVESVTTAPQLVETPAEQLEESELVDELEPTNLLDHPIYAPMIIILIVGNLYLFQKM